MGMAEDASSNSNNLAWDPLVLVRLFSINIDNKFMHGLSPYCYYYLLKIIQA